MVLKVPDAYLGEYAAILYEKYRIKVDETTVSRFFQSKEITRKKVLIRFLVVNYSCKRKQKNAIQYYDMLG